MKQKVGAQTITWGQENRTRLKEILAFLSAEAYEGVEIGMRHFDPEKPEFYKQLFAASGLVPLGLHSGGQFWKPDAAEEERRKLADSLSFAAKVGFRHLVVSGNKAETVESMREAAQTYAEIGRRCADAGLRFAYHNHNWELADDAAILETLVAATGEEVSLVLDVAWAHLGGHELSQLLNRFGKRVAYLHIKDVSGERFCELGRGEMNLPAVLSGSESAGIEWLVIEQDYTDGTPEESMRTNRSYLKTLGV